MNAKLQKEPRPNAPCALEAPAFPVFFVTGLSGAGKSTVLNVFEDMYFFTMDGLPASLIPEVVMVLNRNNLTGFQGLVIGVNMLQSVSMRDCRQALISLRKKGIRPSIIFVEANAQVLLQRYAATRRPHPLQAEGLGLEEALTVERRRLALFRDAADLLIDTSGYSIHDLRRVIQEKWHIMQNSAHALKVHLISFGFKYGTPSEADMVFDLRFLPNPYFVPELKPHSGLDKAVAAYVLEQEPGISFARRITDFLQYLLPLYEAEGRYRIAIAIGCTGGRHRSVALTEALAAALRNKYAISKEHRHLQLG